MRGGYKPTLKPLGATPAFDPLAELLAIEFEKMKRLNAFCSNELRSKLGVLQTSMLLYAEENPRPESEIDHLIYQGLDSLKQTLKRIEQVNKDNKCEIKMIWEVTRDPNIKARRDLPHDFFSVVVADPSSLAERLKTYTPHALVVHGDVFAEVSSKLKDLEAARIPCIISVGANPPRDLLKRAHQSFEGGVDLASVVEWISRH